MGCGDLCFLHFVFSVFLLSSAAVKSLLKLHDVAALLQCINNMLYFGLRMGGGDVFAFSNVVYLTTVFRSQYPFMRYV